MAITLEMAARLDAFEQQFELGAVDFARASLGPVADELPAWEKRRGVTGYRATTERPDPSITSFRC